MIKLVEKEQDLLYVSSKTQTNSAHIKCDETWAPAPIDYHSLQARIGVIEFEYEAKFYSHSYMVIVDTTNTNNLLVFA